MIHGALQNAPSKIKIFGINTYSGTLLHEINNKKGTVSTVCILEVCEYFFSLDIIAGGS